jgi:hypothetical protein
MLTKRLVFTLVILLLVVPGPVAYGYDNVQQDDVRIEAAEHPAEPAWTAYRHAAGSIDGPLDLFYVHAGDGAGPLTATLYITNADELVRSYRYFVLEVGVYVPDGSGGWTAAWRPQDGETLNLRNGQVSFPLAGAAEYKVGIARGSFYCVGAGGGNGDSSLDFNLQIAAAAGA